jgi:hypothetical protein
MGVTLQELSVSALGFWGEMEVLEVSLLNFPFALCSLDLKKSLVLP